MTHSAHPFPDIQSAERAYLRENPVKYPTGRNLSGEVPPPSPKVAAWMAARHNPAWRPPKSPRPAPLRPKRLTDAQRARITLQMETAGYVAPSTEKTSA